MLVDLSDFRCEDGATYCIIIINMIISQMVCVDILYDNKWCHSLSGPQDWIKTHIYVHLNVLKPNLVLILPQIVQW